MEKDTQIQLQWVKPYLLVVNVGWPNIMVRIIDPKRVEKISDQLGSVFFLGHIFILHTKCAMIL